jgi:glycosyltransferase involved in cell wall biosynthesis
MNVDIVCAVYNGEQYLAELIASLEAQTHGDWRLWVRDDGSIDATPRIMAAVAARDTRIHIVDGAGESLGAGRSFGTLIEGLPPDAAYIMCADQDDVWLPRKIERSLDALRAAEAEFGVRTPIIAHCDLTVVNEKLAVIDRSFWSFSAVKPEPVALRRFVVRNPVTGAACIFNRALRELAEPLPPEAIFHDWWLALIAATFGRVVPIPEPMILYRQHSANAVGAHAAHLDLRRLPRTVRLGLSNRARFRAGIEQTAAQARAFLVRYRQRLSATDQAFLSDYANIPSRSFLRRKIDLLRLRALPEHGALHLLGILLRG